MTILDVLRLFGLYVTAERVEWLAAPYKYIVKVYDQATNEHLLVPLSDDYDDWDSILGALFDSVPESQKEVIRYAWGACAP